MSRVDWIEIRGFRGIRQCEIRGFASVNILIGRNNAGKSSVLEAMTRTFCADRELDALNPEARGRHIASHWSRARNEQAVGGGSDFWSPRLVHARSDRLSVSLGGAVNDWKWGMAKATPDQRDVSAPTPNRVHVGLFFPHDTNDPEVERSLWKEVFTSRLDRELMADLNSIFQMPVDSLQMMPDGSLLVGLPSYGLPIDSQGLGVRAAFRMMIVALMSRDGVLAIEEPESHLHPEALDRFAEALTRQSKSRNVQIFLTTHSAECVRAFARAAEATPSEPDREHEWPFAAWFLQRDKDDVVTVRKLAKETVLGLDASGTDVRLLDEFR